jgi:hypothetical protein
VSIHGFVVGIEKYDEPTWDVPGPCWNAIDIANWLLSLGVPPQNVHVFLWPCAETQEKLEVAIRKLILAGVDVRLAGDHASIGAFWRRDLTRDVLPDSRLLVFWSGHGFTSKKLSRIFFCGDYESRLPDRVFNCTNFLNHLLEARYTCFSEQMILLDVCGVYSNLPAMDVIEEIDASATSSQFAYFATPNGRYAIGSGGRGVFTRLALDTLHAQHGWPDQKAFTTAIENAAAQIGETPFRITTLRGENEIRDTVVNPSPEGRDKFTDRFVFPTTGLLQLAFERPNAVDFRPLSQDPEEELWPDVLEQNVAITLGLIFASPNVEPLDIRVSDLKVVLRFGLEFYEFMPYWFVKHLPKDSSHGFLGIKGDYVPFVVHPGQNVYEEVMFVQKGRLTWGEFLVGVSNSNEIHINTTFTAGSRDAYFKGRVNSNAASDYVKKWARIFCLPLPLDY